MSYYLIPVKCLLLKKKRKQVLARRWRNWNPCACMLVGMQKDVTATENSMEVHQETKNRTV